MGKLSTAEVLRLRATSAVSRNPSVRRSAQDDDFVGSLAKNTLDRLALIIASQYDKRCVTRSICAALRSEAVTF
jgi:hypothetical protein